MDEMTMEILPLLVSVNFTLKNIDTKEYVVFHTTTAIKRCVRDCLYSHMKVMGRRYLHILTSMVQKLVNRFFILQENCFPFIITFVVIIMMSPCNISICYVVLM